jgi:low affinity Fe/Cu permease
MMVALSDAQSIAVLVGAATAATTTLGTLLLQVMTYRAGRRRDEKLETIGRNVDGLSEAKAAAAKELGIAEGKVTGIATERHDPHVKPPTGRAPKS